MKTAVGIIFFAAVSLHAENVAWTNAGGDGNWFHAKNWQNNAVPGPVENVLIDGQSSEAQPVLFNGQAAISRLQMAEHEGSEHSSWLSITGGSIGTGVALEQAQIGIRGLATIRQTGGDVVVPSLVIGRLAGGRATWEISGGTLEINGLNDTLVLGDGENSPDKPTTGLLSIQGKATVRVARGIQLGGSSSGTGTIQIIGSMARLEVGKNMNTTSAEIEVGMEGSGNILIKGGWLDVPALVGAEGITLRVGARGKGTGVIQGFGTINTYFKIRRPGLDVGNGLIVADGFGTDGTLNLSSYGDITGAKENTAGFGWYAQNKGRLVLPALTVKPGETQINWGESKDDADIDLVNSLRLTFDKTNPGGRLSVVLLAADHKEVPPGLPPGSAVGVWKLGYPPATPGLSALQVRYYLNGLGEERLRFLHYNTATKLWEPCATTVDAASHRARIEGNLTAGIYALVR